MTNRFAAAAVATLAAGALVAVPVLPAAAAQPGDYDWFFASATNPADVRSFQDAGNTSGNGDFPLVCDATGTGDEPALWRDGTWTLDGAAPFRFGRASDYPLCGDWDGDGVDTVGVIRGSQYFLASANVAGGGSVVSFGFGRYDDFPLVGDWDGNGTDTIALARGKDYFFASANTNGGGAVRGSSFGRADDFPVAGDWDGDGSDTLGLRRGKVFYLTDAAAGTPSLVANRSVSFGRDSDYPVAGTLAGDTDARVGLIRLEE